MKPRLAAAVVIVAVMSIAFAPLAAATTDSPITFVTTTVGGRTLTTASGPTFTTQNLVNAQTADSTAALTTVSEVFAGSNDWSVTAELCGLTVPDATTPVKDCSKRELDRNEPAPAATIPGTSIHATTTLPTGALNVLHAGTTTFNADGAALSSVITVLNNTGKTAGNTYNGVYTASTTLQIQNLSQTGTWRGFWVVTAFL